MTLCICLLCWRDTRCSNYSNGRKSGAPCPAGGRMSKAVASLRFVHVHFLHLTLIRSIWCSHIAAFEDLYFCTRNGWGLSLGLWFSNPAGPAECCRDQTDSDFLPPAFQKGTFKYQSHLSHMLSTSGKTIHFAYVGA